MNLIIRPASMNDVETLLQFEQGVINAERPFDITIKKDHTHYYDLEELITNPDVEFVVAQSEGEIIGCGYVRIENAKPYLSHTKHGYMGFMYVKPDFRGEGVNQKIIETLQQWSLANGITEMRLEVYHENIPAIKAYEKVGFSKLKVEMRMELEK